MFRVSDLILTDLRSSLGRRGAAPPLALHSTDVTTTYAVLTDTLTIFEVMYALTITDRDGNRACSIDVGMAAYCHTPSRPEPEDAVAYTPHLLRFQHDTLREYLRTMTQWMGMPPLLLELPYGLLELTSPDAGNPPGR